ncbi:MAG: glycosyltransferase family 2 protein [Lachnospiraceae bacterium]|nr:glycosyltransferase family 2 protein [Lachnospiraceae bacterium]
MDRNNPVLYLVLPCYNESETIGHSAVKVKEKLIALKESGKISPFSKALFVDDGSKDDTLAKLHALSSKDDLFAVVALASNRGHQNAIMAGMMVAREYADAVVTIDVDLQQDIDALDEFIEKYKAGNDVVYGIRKDRKSDGFLKKITASGYYGFMHMLGADIMTNHADYRLLSKRALDMLSEYDETNLFLRGLIPTMGFTSDVVYFDVREREFGKSKYTAKKMVHLALDGITSMSIRPLEIISVIGFVIFLISIAIGIFTLIEYFKGNNIPGYTTSIFVSLLMGGVTLVSLGVIGEYLGKIYMETKHRPRYMIDSVVIRETGKEEKEK